MDVKKAAEVIYKRMLVLDLDAEDLLKHLDEALDFIRTLRRYSRIHIYSK